MRGNQKRSNQERLGQERLDQKRAGQGRDQNGHGPSLACAWTAPRGLACGLLPESTSLQAFGQVQVNLRTFLVRGKGTVNLFDGAFR